MPDLNSAQAAVLKFSDDFRWSRASFCGPPRANSSKDSAPERRHRGAKIRAKPLQRLPNGMGRASAPIIEVL